MPELGTGHGTSDGKAQVTDVQIIFHLGEAKECHVFPSLERRTDRVLLGGSQWRPAGTNFVLHAIGSIVIEIGRPVGKALGDVHIQPDIVLIGSEIA